MGAQESFQLKQVGRAFNPHIRQSLAWAACAWRCPATEDNCLWGWRLLAEDGVTGPTEGIWVEPQYLLHLCSEGLTITCFLANFSPSGKSFARILVGLVSWREFAFSTYTVVDSTDLETLVPCNSSTDI